MYLMSPLFFENGGILFKGGHYLRKYGMYLLICDKSFNFGLKTQFFSLCIFFKSKTRGRWLYLLNFSSKILDPKRRQHQTSLQIPIIILNIGVPSDFVFPTLNLNLEHQGGSLARGKGRFAQLALICDKNIYLLNLFSIASAYMSMFHSSKL